MDSSTSYQANFNLLKKRVIEPAIKELQEKDNWIINWNVLKKGRKISHLQFNFSKIQKK